MPKEGVHNTCIAYITNDSAMRMKKKLSTKLFWRIQIQNKENKDAWVYTRWIRIVL